MAETLAGRIPLSKMPDMTLNKIMVGQGEGNQPVEESKATGAGAYLTVTAADTPSILKGRADYECDGTNSTGGDQSEINTALGVANTVLLAPGTFWVDASISIDDNQSLLGCGKSTIIKQMDSHDDDSFHAIVNADQTNGNTGLWIANILFDGNEGNNANSQRAIYFVKVGPTTADELGCKVEGCTFQSWRGKTIHLNTARVPLFLNNIIRSNLDDGIFGDALVYDGIFSGNIVIGNSGCGFKFFDGTYRTVFVNNELMLNGLHGFHLSDNGSDNRILGNLFFANSQTTDDTYSGIAVEDNIDHTLISHNVCRQGTEANQPKYGIHIVNNTCDYITIHGNDLYDSGKTGDLLDAGTNTQARDNIANAGAWL